MVNRTARLLYYVFCLAFLLTGCVSADADVSSIQINRLRGLTIVIDPGHGGIDHGAIGVAKTQEDMLNLQVSMLLKDKLTQADANVVMTRNSNAVDYSGTENTKKRRDMNNRGELIKQNKPDIIVSIHMNKYPNKKYYGPQTFYWNDNIEGRKLASDIQDELIKALPCYKRYRIIAADFYILHVVKTPSALVECGFLSNADDEKRLKDKNYQQIIADCIFNGICNYYLNPLPHMQTKHQ